MEVKVRPLERSIDVEPGANLLEALRANDVPVSHSCLAGRCGTCRCKVVQGSVLESGREVQRPLDGEQRFVLACQTFITEPCSIEILEPDEVVVHTARITKATVVSIADATHDIKILRLRPSKQIDFSPGQYAQLQFTPEHIRPYSMAGLCTDDELEFHVRLVDGGRVTAHIANELQVGASVRVSGPMGSAYLRRKHDGPMICVAGGTGLAPILSIMKGAIAEGMRNPMYLYFGVRSERDLYGLNWIEAIKKEHPLIRVHVVLSFGAVEGYRTGLVTNAIAEDWSSLENFRAYLCGAPPMVEAVTLLVQKLGLLPERVYADAFYPSGT